MIKKWRLVTLLTVLTPLYFMPYALAEQLENQLITITTKDKQVTTNDVDQYLTDNGLGYQDLFSAESSLRTTCTSDFCRYIDFDMVSGTFINKTVECRWAVFTVTSGTGYYGIWHHRAEPFQPFGWPPYSNGSTSVTKRGLTSLPCSNTPPGTSY
ncbi:hypothetical protein ABHN84_17295 [Shewanella vesiculosa]|uniref:Uncharacterized protein n=1 Tax=Shewanella vesiculosa TaxID=518738 RepID=A0ABV0FTW2_9GAMM